MRKNETLLEKVLRSNNYSVTRPRLLVFNLLINKPPQSIRDLIVSLDTQIDRVSVYRVIKLYEKLGIVHRIMIGWKYKIELSDIFLDHHHHISCLGCGRVVAIREEKGLEELIQKLAKTSGFVMTSHQLELQGHCGQCQQHTNSQSV